MTDKQNPVWLVYGDFMKNDHDNRLVLTRGSFEDLAKHGLEPAVGLHLLFYNEDEDKSGDRDDLVVEGVLDFDKEHQRWVAVIDWDAIQNISGLSLSDKKRFGIDP